MSCIVMRAPMRRIRALAVAALPFLIASRHLPAQSPPKDSARIDSGRVQQLEKVLISAVRASGTAPISEKTLRGADIARRSFGQDVPLLVQGATPSLTSYAETGNYWGYSYIRLRGIDQSRINLTLDGIPLNDPEDQVLYFADFPDLANSLQSVQVQRGTGTSSAGTASYGGAVKFETPPPPTLRGGSEGQLSGGSVGAKRFRAQNPSGLPLATMRGGSEVQLSGGSFGAKRLSAEYQSGLLPSRFAVYARMSAQRVDGYRHHSGVDARSAFLSAGWFGDRDIVKLTATAGL